MNKYCEGLLNILGITYFIFAMISITSLLVFENWGSAFLCPNVMRSYAKYLRDLIDEPYKISTAQWCFLILGQIGATFGFYKLFNELNKYRLDLYTFTIKKE